MFNRLNKIVKKNKLDVIIVIALFCVAFGIRTVPSDKFDNIYGFDSFWAARMTKYLLTQGYIWPLYDQVTDYPYGRPDSRPGEIGWWGLNAMAYTVISPFAGVSGFDYGLFGAVASWMVAIAGALGVVAIYLFGKVGFNRFVGLASALFLTVNGGHFFYSFFGHAENDALGFSLFFLCLFSFILTVKKQNWRYGLLTTALFSWLASTWLSYKVLILLLAGTILLYFIIYLIFNAVGYYKNSSQREKGRRWMIYTLVFALPSVLFCRFIAMNYWDLATVLPIVGTVLICSLIEWYTHGDEITFPNISSIKKWRTWHPVMKAASIALVVLVIYGAFYGTKMVIQPLAFVGINLDAEPPIVDYHARMLTTIAEQNPVAGGNFLGRLDYLGRSTFGVWMIWLALLAVVFAIAKLCIMPFIRKDFRYEWDILALFFILLSLFMLTSRAQSTFFLAAAVAFGAGYFMGSLIDVCEFFSKTLGKYKNYAKAAVFGIILLIFFSYNIGGVQNAESIGYDVNPEWIDTFDFINTLPQGSVITAWWDYGHWIAYWNGDNVYISLDNIQDRPDIIYTVASAFTHTTGPKCRVDIQTPECPTSDEDFERAEVESLSLLKPLKTTHIIIDKEIIGGTWGGKFGALETIAANHVGCMQLVGCGDTAEGIYCPFGTNDQGQQVGIPFTQQQWDELKNTDWPGMSLTEIGLPTRAFARDDSWGHMLYLSALSCGQFQAAADSPVLYAFAQRLFFRDPNLKHVKLVYDDSWNVIYEVNWDGIPDPINSVLPPIEV